MTQEKSSEKTGHWTALTIILLLGTIPSIVGYLTQHFYVMVFGFSVSYVFYLVVGLVVGGISIWQNWSGTGGFRARWRCKAAGIAYLLFGLAFVVLLFLPSDVTGTSSNAQIDYILDVSLPAFLFGFGTICIVVGRRENNDQALEQTA